MKETIVTWETAERSEIGPAGTRATEPTSGR